MTHRLNWLTKVFLAMALISATLGLRMPGDIQAFNPNINQHVHIISNETVKYSETLIPGWETIGFDDSTWLNVIAPSGGLCDPSVPSRIPDSEALPVWSQTPHQFQTIYARKTFMASSTLTATIHTMVDDDFDLYVNGVLVRSDWDGVASYFIDDVSSLIQDGLNVIALKARDTFGGCQHLGFDLILEQSDLILSEIDIIPTKFPNIVYPTITDPKDYKGLILVSVLTTLNFDARTVDPASVRFGPAGASAIQSRGVIKDVDRDGDVDITFGFRIVYTGIMCGDTSASLSGATFDGQSFIGSDSIQTEGCSGYDIDRAALLALYESTNGDGWWNNSGWLTDTNHCIWQGVACDETGRVQHLYLNSNNLSGTIPPKLGNLQKLQRLDLSTNHINGPIPPELGNLQDLNYIGLHDNQVSGTIPPELGNLHNLGSLYLNYNQLSGSIPSELGTLWNLEFLNLNNNNLSGPIPPELGNLQNLQGLELDNNQINGSIPPELGNLQNLNYISLRNNQLNGPIPSELGNLQNLNFISLSDNKLNGPIPPELGDLQNMFHLSLENNQLSGTIPLELSNPQNLWFIILNNNQLSGSIPPELSNLQHLNGLNLSNNQLSGSIPPELGNMQSLIELNLSNNQLSGPIPPELGNMQNLHVLELSTNQLSGSTPPELGNLLSLNILEVSSNQLSGSIPPELGNLQWVYELDLSNNQLSGPIPLELGNMRRLSILYLYPGNGGLICVSNPDLWAFLSSLGDYSGPGYCPPPPYYTALLHSPGVFKIVSTFGLLSAGLMLGLGLVIGFPVRRYRHHEKQ